MASFDTVDLVLTVFRSVFEVWTEYEGHRLLGGLLAYRLRYLDRNLLYADILRLRSQGGFGGSDRLIAFIRGFKLTVEA